MKRKAGIRRNRNANHQVRLSQGPSSSRRASTFYAHWACPVLIWISRSKIAASHITVTQLKRQFPSYVIEPEPLARHVPLRNPVRRQAWLNIFSGWTHQEPLNRTSHRNGP